MAEDLKRHGITFSLDLNKHPKDATNLSLINAENFKISEDGASLVSDKSLLENEVIKNKLNEYYEGKDYEIIYCITTNDEIVLFVVSNYVEDNYYDLDLFRYSEKLITCSNSIIPSEYEKMKYYGGKFSGTFTYNVKNELIIAFCEYDSVFPTEFECGEPMKIINLGYWENNIQEENIDNWILINDSNLNHKTFPICPEVNIPSMINDEIISGNSKKGWYHFYIRYKINNYDYTQWFDFGKSFYLDEGKEIIIFDYPAKTTTTNLSQDAENNWTHKIYCSSEEDICNKTIKFTLNNLSNLYSNYQIGFICSTKIYNECKITDDIDINNIEFILNYSNCNDYDNTQIIKNYNNYYNVKNIINYNNRLYITNYKTRLNENIKNDIDVKIVDVENEESSIKEVIVNVNNENKKIKLTNGKIKAKDLYGVEKLYTYRNKINKHTTHTGITASSDEYTFHNDLYKLFIDYSVDTGESFIKYILTRNGNTLESDQLIQIYKVHFLRANGKGKDIIENNSSIFNGQSLKFVKNYWCKRQYIYYYEYTGLTDISNYEYEYDEENQKLTCNNISDNLKIIGRSIDKYNNFSKAKTNIPFPVNVTENVEYKSISKEYYIIPDILDENKLNYKFTLIPKQPYTFYIHYVDKYGQISDGHQIYNNIGFKEINDDLYIKIFHAMSGTSTPLGISTTYSIELYYNLKDISNCNIESLLTYGNYPLGDYKIDINKIHFDIKIINDEIKNDFVKYNELINYTANNISLKKYFDDNNHKIYIQSASRYSNGVNLNNKLEEELTYYDRHDELKYHNYIISDIIKYFINHKYNMSYLLFNNIVIPKNYVSYFISYEKLNKVQIWEGISSNKKFYTDKLNYRDNININIHEDNNNIIIDKVNYKIANSYKDENFGLSSHLDIKYKNEDELDLDYNFNNLQYLYKNFTNLYSKNNKVLIRITDISNNPETISKTYGFYSYLSAIEIIKPYRINSANILIEYDKTNVKLDSIPIEVDRQVNRFQYIPDSSKQINNPPKLYKTNISTITIDNPEAKFYDSYLFLPQDTIDLFKNNALDYDESVLSIYTNYNEDNVNQTDFIKTIRRSTYIKDESLENGWRTFESEAYQNIQENKGEITRTEGIGDLLLVHTKDSLFQFDKSNLLVTENKTVQLGQQDTFDVGYKEIFTSPFGYGGLQDKEAAIVGEFGYIWYNNDFNKIYQYNAGSLNIISGNIEFLLNKYKPTKCRFVDDKENKRLLIQFQLNNTQILNLTYNYDIKAFISFYIDGDNIINETYNTKTKFYILENNKIYNEFDKSNAKKLSFIINENYTKIKRLNFIKYKLYKGKNEDEEFNASSPVEGNISHIINYRTPYSGYKLRVYNDLCDTGELPIDVDYKHTDEDITKPYYDLGNFTFNYLRDKDTDSQIFGNFFIVEFIFNQNDEDIIEFESLEYGIDYEEN